ncbi:hypothetical protein FGB62_92g119 [Gracilaria domingensis]|nr:hypothetical protein FGB62_92g119 [Gracilaria domingensis]
MGMESLFPCSPGVGHAECMISLTLSPLSTMDEYSSSDDDDFLAVQAKTIAVQNVAALTATLPSSSLYVSFHTGRPSNTRTIRLPPCSRFKDYLAVNPVRSAA